MFASTLKGREAQIRQLGAELHLESDYKVVQHLLNYVNKFHLVWPEEHLEELSPTVE